ncbi:MAG: phosphate/phosphite/phosphonate ABC transporter substrate-binding protein [Desulfobacteraceae bacterium]|nr:phosphate/phosphite/phosphonate ABC transporter substrate-binding protein [Desulfobacteraceae bacterium]
MGMDYPLLRKAYLFFWFMTVALFLAAQGCGGDGDIRVVDFSKTIPAARQENRSYDSSCLRVAVAAMVSPKETFVSYHQMLDYIGSRLGKNIELIQRKTYGEISEFFGRGLIDLAFICSGPYATGREKYGFEPLAIPQVKGSPFYRAYLIVNKDSPFHTLEDLRGWVFAFTDPGSNTGRLVPVYWLAQMQEQPETFFGKTIHTYSHDNSILAVARGLVDGASVHGLIWEYYHHKSPLLTSRTRIIKKSESYGNPPLVAARGLPSGLKARIRELVLSMHQDPQGQRILHGLMIDRFVVPQEEWYEPVRRMKEKLTIVNEIAYAQQKTQN